MSAFRAALVALSAAVLTAACAAGQHAATADEKPSLDGTQGQVGPISLEGVSLRAPSGTSYSSGADVPLTLYIANNSHSSDTLTNVTSTAFTGGWDVVATGTLNASQPSPAASSAPAASSSPVPGTPQQIGAGAALALGLQNLTPSGSASPRTLVLNGLAAKNSPLYPGTAVKITFTFAKAGQATLTVPVQLTAKPNTQTLPGSNSPA